MVISLLRIIISFYPFNSVRHIRYFCASSLSLSLFSLTFIPLTFNSSASLIRPWCHLSPKLPLTIFLYDPLTSYRARSPHSPPPHSLHIPLTISPTLTLLHRASLLHQPNASPHSSRSSPRFPSHFPDALSPLTYNYPFQTRPHSPLTPLTISLSINSFLTPFPFFPLRFPSRYCLSSLYTF